MIINRDNYIEKFEIFKNSCDLAKFVSFDCEMTGLTIDLKTEFTKYDSHEFRYYKLKQSIEKFALIQFGLTFFIEKERTKKDSNTKEDYYLERSFTFYLFKNPNKDYYFYVKDRNIFNITTLINPSSLKFLSLNNFNFDTLVSKGINFTKLAHAEKIRNYLNKDNIDIMNNNSFLSLDNEIHLIDKIIELAEFLLFTKVEPKQKKPTKIIKFNTKIAMNYFLGYNFKEILFVDNFNIQKLKSEQNSVEVKITKATESELFNTEYNSFDDFKKLLKDNHNLLYEFKNKKSKDKSIIKEDKEKYINNVINTELGFANFIKYLSDKKIPIIGHNIYLDLMFIYDKLIADLPPDFYTFKTKLHKYFPIIYDTKSIAMSLSKYEKTSLDLLHRSLYKYKYNSYVSFEDDEANGFIGDKSGGEKSDKLHDAGFDSKITGECFVLMNKALENNYVVDNGGDKKGKKKNCEKEKIDIKYGFCNLDLFKQFENRTYISLVESENGKIFFDTDIQSKDDYIEQEKKLINNFNNVYVVKFDSSEDNIINNYEIANLFSNNFYNLNIMKIDSDMVFLEFSCNEGEEQKYDGKFIIDLINKIKNDSDNNSKQKLKIKEIYTYENFIMKFQDFIKI